MDTQSPKWHLNFTDMKQVMLLFIHAAIGFIITYGFQLITNINFGIYTPLVAVAITTLSGFLKQYMSGPDCQVAPAISVPSVFTNIPTAGSMKQTVTTASTIPTQTTLDNLPG